ncbi:MAG: 3-phosphoshikimate 1-carboxyvinyltransferase [Burkholderiaceae bacterium]|jgi:3-phosphoshikimate 1-carboxyvinyltransferase|nr:3-phosphoshikimate 1-carboxyvinyltransferase [Burkholderiaceae bacterium]
MTADYTDLPVSSRVEGTVRLPGSKSISNRTLLLAFLAEGTTDIQDLLASDDTEVMLQALQQLGVAWQWQSATRSCAVHGTGGALPVRQADLFMGNAGTAIRPLTAALAVLGGDFTLHGIPRMHERPIGDLVSALNAAGAHITYTGEEGYPPLRIQTGRIRTPVLQVKGNVSSQFLTALLMAAPLMAREQDIRIEVVGELISRPYIDLTLNLMRRFGVTVEERTGPVFLIGRGQSYKSPGRIHVEGDASSASYFLAAGAIAGGIVRVEGVGQSSIQGDVQFAQALEQMGAHVRYGDNWIAVTGGRTLNAISAEFGHIPDAAMTVAILALYAKGTSTLRGIGSWRVKETDRIAAMATELRKLGAQVEEGADWISVLPPEVMQSAEIDTYGDHRMAMCFSLASLDGVNRKGVPLRLRSPGVVAKTFPEYFQAFARITGRAAADSII